MKGKLLIVLAGFLSATLALAQPESGRQWEYKMFAGYNLGGSTPLPLPAEIRKIHSWSPGIAGTLAFHATRWLTTEWGITSGLAIDVKGMIVDTDVKYLNTSLIVGEGDHTGTFTGMFTGRNTTKLRNGYLVFPLLASYHPFSLWTFHLGGYFALQRDARFEGNASGGYIRNGGPAGDRINIEMSTFDFSDYVRKTDAGLMALADWFFTNKLAVTGQLSWGLLPLFPSDFNGIPYKMYNIYFMGGIAYRL
ncbi:MAG: PorT family protein [Tannerellaceae bacterium]|nr:PorT family protein [Tannerellaceae bacterium]